MPEHPFPDGVILYVTVPGASVLLVSTWLIVFPVPAANPAVPAVPPTVQLKAAAVTAEVKFSVAKLPLHKASVAGEATTSGIGLTVI